MAILSSDAFNAVNQIDVLRLTFGKTGNEQSLSVHKRNGPEFEIRDVNGDGRLDIVAYFKTKSTGLRTGDTAAVLKGTLKDGSTFAVTTPVTLKNGKK